MRYVNLNGDTVFSGGPITIQARPAGSRRPAGHCHHRSPTGPGAQASSVEVLPAGGTFVAGTATQFTHIARDNSSNVLANTPVLYSSPDAASVAPSMVAIRSVCLATSAGPCKTFCNKAMLRISVNMSRRLLYAAPSAPRETETPRSTNELTGAIPDPSLRFEDGQCET